ncbi:GNAT family N-acetyltransferase [Klebsiella aerogenes]|uniref:GNAT family N-acetyltransferase n=1 Tax=Klebsiella aerogenes TaxID=548 RepID=UPI000CDD261C|nr:GNAT family N-acetyltransferase [Klebsiella aerogenes]ELS5744927.1 GNAT family N-acetyltransferase [Klebsiella aerogenes]MBY5233228.1 GNAT family N-acetyltransferase [Klebsiella aerogenes]POU59358.1 GNAT family N-acetyltransferase [Klebsiella aerogenes]WBM99520.1 GNAT family N-acetyltransferase [Klebsiella aerogenes]HBS0189309.1 GNAT family N-acetyltransferase [Klebsiella aerogenes]
MRVRRAVPDEAPALWNIRNQAIRHGCRQSYGAEVIHAWTPEQMPEGYRHAVADNPFYIVENRLGQPVATGYLDIESLSVEAIFTLPECGGQGCADLIMRAVIAEARRRGLETITLEATPNAAGFYLRHGFVSHGEKSHYSKMANAELRCIAMSLTLD